MNLQDIETLLIDMELLYADRIPEAPGHFKPQAVAGMIAKLPLLLSASRELLEALKSLDKQPNRL